EADDFHIVRDFGVQKSIRAKHFDEIKFSAQRFWTSVAIKNFLRANADDNARSFVVRAKGIVGNFTKALSGTSQMAIFNIGFNKVHGRVSEEGSNENVCGIIVEF